MTECCDATNLRSVKKRKILKIQICPHQLMVQWTSYPRYLAFEGKSSAQTTLCKVFALP